MTRRNCAPAAAWCWTACLAATLVFGPVQGIAQAAGPTFDCRKAAHPAEKAICADGELARLDRTLGTLWKAVRRGFEDEKLLAAMRRDQAGWLSARNDCKADAACIAASYRKRIAFLGGAGGDSFPGVFEAKDVGTATVYRMGERYAVSIRTSDPAAGNWTCELEGTATANGRTLSIVSGDLRLPADLAAPDTFTVMPGEPAEKAEAQACGLNGRLAFSFRRVAF